MALAQPPLVSNKWSGYHNHVLYQLEPLSCPHGKKVSLLKTWPYTELSGKAPWTRMLGSFTRVAPRFHERRKSIAVSVTLVNEQEVDGLEKEGSEFEDAEAISLGRPQFVDNGRLSARDRRKLRNERRQDTAKLKAEEKEERELEMSQRKKKKESWDEKMDTNRLAVHGVQWWMIQVPRNAERTVAETILARVTDKYPDRLFEVLVPTVPARTTLKDGSIHKTEQRLYPGTVLVKCQLNKELHDFILATPKARSFMGYKVGPKFREKVMAVPMDHKDVDNMFKAIADAEVEMAQFQEESKEVAKAKRQERAPRVIPVIEPGVTIQVTKGPFLNCAGKVLELKKDEGRIRVNLAIFGRMTPVDLSLGDVKYCAQEAPDSASPAVDIARS